MTNTTASHDGYLMGIDFGTESVRVALYDTKGTPITFAATPYKTTHPRPGWAEQHPDEWLACLTASCHKVLDKSGVSPSKILGISYDATTMTVVALDENGTALRPAIMWMDVRATEQAGRIADIDTVAKLYNGNGTAPASAEWYPFKTAWLKENERETYDKAFRIVDATDWLTYTLTGEWSISINTAAHRMYYNRDKGGWPVDLYEHLGIGDVFGKLPENVLDLGTPIGTLSPRMANTLGLVAGIPVAQGAADAWAGQIGLGVVNAGKLALITGSSHVITGQSAEPIHGAGFFGSYTDGVVPGQYTVEGGQVSTGSVMKWFKDKFTPDLVAAADRAGLSIYDVLNMKSADIPPGSEGLIVNEYFQGNRTPYVDGKARGAIYGLSLSHGPEHLYKAIEEGICYGTAHNLKVMRDQGFEPQEIVAAGGATRGRSFMQMHSDVTGVPITLTEVGDAVALGSSMMAAVGAGIYANLQEAADNMVKVRETIEPRMDVHEQYQFYLERYMELFPKVRDSIHALVDHEAAK
ncbi:FGGY-family carbohydrate kinase [Flaviflexus huanghaiensis]|uniref:FGGY-family carbohydrate kinase n=1 Tax=Flaviflexus huanghaiensis TaxID=1111473 RepID=UPI0015FDE5BF|nr:FGGY family carbohydrate kinase [Flaviflexus huanghaiensis]